jgi:hypothetical protein
MYFYEVRKIFWISLWTRKSKTKQKAFATGMAESELILCSRTTYSSGVVSHFSKTIS